MKKLLALACLVCLPSCSQAASFTLDLGELRKAFTTAKTSHKLIYIAESVALAASLGVDGGSSEYALANSKRYVPSCSCYVTVLRETNPFFLSHSADGQTHFSQPKFWSYKILFGLTPFAVTRVVHQLAPADWQSDILSIGFAGAETGFFIYISERNYKLGHAVKLENQALGK